MTTQTFTVEGKSKSEAYAKIKPELKKRKMVLIKTSVKRIKAGVYAGPKKKTNIYEFRAKTPL